RRVRYRIYTSSATASPRLLPSFPTRRSSDLAVDVELLDPVARVGDEEVANLVAAEVEDVGAPVGLLAAAGVGVLVERGAVEAGQDRKSTRLNSSHVKISYAVFCLKKKKESTA